MVQIVALFTLGIFGAYVGIHLNNLAATALVIGIVFGTRNFIQIFLRVPLSELSQIIGRKPMIISGIFSYSIALGLLYIANSWKIVLIAVIILGIGMSMHWPAVFSYIGDISDDTNYGKISGIVFQGQDIGVIIYTLFARYMLLNDIISLRQLFGISFVVGIIGSISAIFILPEVLNESNRMHVTSIKHALWKSFVGVFKSVWELSRQYPLIMIFTFEMTITFTEFFIQSFFPLLVVVSLGYDDSIVATVILVSTSIQVFFKKYYGHVFDKWGYQWPIIISLSFVSMILYLLTIGPNYIELLFLYTVMMAFIFVCFIATTGATNSTVKPIHRGLSMGVLGVYISSGRALSSFLLGTVLSYFETSSGSREQGLILMFRFSSKLIFGIVVILAIVSIILNKKFSEKKLTYKESEYLSVEMLND